MQGDISFNIYFARDYGTNEAVLFQNILYWCDFNRMNNRNFHDGLYWTFNKASAFSMQFPFLTERQVRYALAKLEEKGLIKSGNFNKTRYDQTKWYAVTRKGLEKMAEYIEEAKDTLTKESNPNDKTASSNLQICKLETTQMSDLYQMNTHSKPNLNTDDVSDSAAQEPERPSEKTTRAGLSHGKNTESKNAFSQKQYSAVLDAYYKNCTDLFFSGKIKTEHPAVPAYISRTLKKCFSLYGFEAVLEAVKESKNHEWLVERGYPLSFILGQNEIVNLINKTYSRNPQARARGSPVPLDEKYDMSDMLE